MSETIAYGVRCSWWDDKDNVGAVGSGKFPDLPCCPHCKGMLFEIPKPEWVAGLDRFDANHKGYREFIAWRRGRCLRNLSESDVLIQLAKFTAETGLRVEGWPE